ncbi:dof zinc finger protein DOF5.4-like [Hibiscus syriacus]|uniref:dof zinc finger protein DOF5.4-like n=1 Tax=Hibiscus syriacus TaxID=106335 RepID=UPI001920E9DA|nr:dof zinc finger protein DOF5.4-like [Hibiscus syriacus]
MIDLEALGLRVKSHPNKVKASEPKLHGNPNKLSYEPGSQSGIFPKIGKFSSLVTPYNNETPSFRFSTLFNGQGQWQQQKIEEITEGLLDHTMQVELSKLHGKPESGFGPLDWQDSVDQQLFDLPNEVDQTYWSQSQWIDQDHPTHYLREVYILRVASPPASAMSIGINFSGGLPEY